MSRPLPTLGSVGFENDPVRCMEIMLAYYYLGKTARSTRYKVYSLPETIALNCTSLTILVQTVELDLKNHLGSVFDEVVTTVDAIYDEASGLTDLRVKITALYNGQTVNGAYSITYGTGLMKSITDSANSNRDLLKSLSMR